MPAIDLISKASAAPMTHVVITTYADGRANRHETRSAATAENWAVGERRKIGRDLISRNADMTAGPVVHVVSVNVVPL